MPKIENIYLMSYSCEDDRPLTLSEEQGLTWDDWEDIEPQFPPGVDTLPCKRLSFHVNRPDALDWDWYDAHYPGMISQQAKDLLWPYAEGCLRSFQTTLNGSPYYILRLDEELAIDCLDREHSELEYFKSSGRIMEIKKHAFHLEKLHDPLIFHIPEGPNILCTQTIKRIVEDAGLKGFSFEDAEQLRRSE